MTNMFLENAYYIEETVRQASNKAPERIKLKFTPNMNGQKI